MRILDSILTSQLPGASACIALGLFDGLHRGHMSVIEDCARKARECGLYACVFTFTMHSGIPEKKRRDRLISFERFTGILSDAGIDYIFRPDFGEFRDIPPRDFAAILKDRLGAVRLFCGESFRFGKNASAGARDLAGYGLAKVEIEPTFELDGMTVSSSAIRECIREGDIKAANLLLGRRFSIDFEVVTGRALGRTLGTPTINQPFPAGFATPRFGVYATTALIGKTFYPAVTNVGIKPTVGSGHVLAETYIHGFSGDLYGQNIRVDFVKFIRPERKFPDIDALKAQILADCAEAAVIVAAER